MLPRPPQKSTYLPHVTLSNISLPEEPPRRFVLNEHTYPPLLYYLPLFYALVPVPDTTTTVLSTHDGVIDDIRTGFPEFAWCEHRRQRQLQHERAHPYRRQLPLPTRLQLL